MVENDLYEHEKWEVLNYFWQSLPVNLQSKHQRLFWGKLLQSFAKFERQKYTFWSKLFWPFAIFRPSSEIKVIPDLLESGFFFRVEISATYLWNGSKQASAVDLWERHEEKFLSIGKWVNRNVGWLLTLPLFHILNEPLGDLYIKIYIYAK